MEFRLLGPVELWANDRQIDLGTTKVRSLLAVLLLEAGHAVPVETLVYRVWGEEPPPKVISSVHANLSRLRGRLELAGADRVQLEHTHSAYRLLVAPEDVDALEFTRIVIEGQAAASGAEPERALRLLQTASAMVRGTPLADLSGDWFQSVRAGLQERHRSATLTRIGLQLANTDPQLLIGELRELSGNHPLDQAVTMYLMRALHAAGRTADAVEEFHATRRRLADQLGLDPQRALQDLYQRILEGDALTPQRLHAPSLASETQPSPNTLERDPPGFVGRESDLEALRTEIAVALRAGRSALCMINGMPGVGKTAAALHLAHELHAQCPDGALQIAFRSHDPHQAPTSPEAALRLLLSMVADGRDMERVATLDQALALWRRLAHGRRLLFLFDDVGAVEQIQPLLPNGPGSIVLVTSRRQLAEVPGAIHHTLRPLLADEAQQLFIGTAAARGNDDASAVDAVVKICGRLPLALTIAGALFRTRSTWTTTDFAERLTRSLRTQGMDGLSESLNITFETSYRDLPELPRRMLRRLALHPGPRISLFSAAAVAGTKEFDAEFALDTLVSHHLLSEPQPHRYEFHDLVKTFASHTLERDDSPDEIRASRDRLITFAVAATDRATARFHPHRHVNLAPRDDGRLAVPEFGTAQQAAAWLDAEHETLRQLATDALDNGWRQEGGALAHLLAVYLDRRCLWPEAITLHEHALGMWARVDNAVGQAHALIDLATAFWRIRSLDQARSCSEAALGIWTRLGDLEGQADALLELGRTHHSAHQADEAIERYRQAAKLRARQRDPHGESQVLCHLGVIRFHAGDHSGGIADTQRALELARVAHSEVLERNCLNNLGEFYRQRGAYKHAETCYKEAMTLAERVGDPRNIAVAALNLGEVHTLTHQPNEALNQLDTALASFTRLGTRSSVGNALLAKVRAHLEMDDLEQAAACLEQATTIAGPLDDQLFAAQVHLTGGALYIRRREYEAALAEFRSALARARRAHAMLEQAAAHRGIGDTQAATGSRPALARSAWRKALELYESVQAPEVDELRARLEDASTAETDRTAGSGQL